MIRKSTGWPLAVVANELAVDESTILKNRTQGHLTVSRTAWRRFVRHVTR